MIGHMGVVLGARLADGDPSTCQPPSEFIGHQAANIPHTEKLKRHGDGKKNPLSQTPTNKCHAISTATFSYLLTKCKPRVADVGKDTSPVNRK